MKIHNFVANVAASATVMAQLAPVGTLMMAAPAAAQSSRVEIQCYSQPGQQNSCALPPGTRSVTFMGPDRSGRCREGQTWRKRGQSLWVADGCGGVFEAAVYGGGSGSGWGGSGGNWGSGYAGEITCRSINNREERCRVNTGGRVQLVRQISNAACIEGQTWRYDRNAIWVRNGCQAVFAYGNAVGGGSGGGWGGSGGSWGGSGGSWGSGYAGEIRCRSDRNRYNRCSVSTEGRVQIIERLSNASCTQGRSWGYDSGGIWVNHGCEARFAYGRGSYQPQYGSSGGSSNSGGDGSAVAAGLLGAGLAAGLIAILNSRGGKHDASRPNASLQADYGLFPASAQAEARACMAEGARQLGATGATSVRLDRVVSTETRGAGWHLVTDVTGRWPNETTRLRLDCTATDQRVTSFDVAAL